MMSDYSLTSRKRRVFDSVFQKSLPSQPTPNATPLTAFTGPGQAFGDLPTPLHPHQHSSFGSPVDNRGSHYEGQSSSDQVVWDRSWHIATSYVVSLCRSDQIVVDQHGDLNTPASLSSPDSTVTKAIKAVVKADELLPGASYTEDLVTWYSEQTQFHFLNTILPLLDQASIQADADSLLSRTVQILERAHRLYLHGFSSIVKQLDESKPNTSANFVARFRAGLHAVVSKTLSDRVWTALRRLLADKVDRVLVIASPVHTDGVETSQPEVQSKKTRSQARKSLASCVESLHYVGMTGERFNITFAEVMNEAMSNYVDRYFRGVWTSGENGALEDGRDLVTASTIDISRRRSQAAFQAPQSSFLPRTANHASTSRCVLELCDWIENDYARLIVEVLNKADGSLVDYHDLEKWKEISIGRLAGLRMSELYDVVKIWPNGNGALEDLRAAITTPQQRLMLTDAFSNELKARLLHAGSSTLEILRLYISMIWSFHFLDQSRVLLDRVAYQLQLYLCMRDDTVRIVLTGLLADTGSTQGQPGSANSGKLVELAILLNEGAGQVEDRLDNELDWTDMEWQPDPVDAGPGYKRSKSADIIGTLIGVLGSQDVFIREFQSIVAENLLGHDGDFEKELKVLELLKSRFGEPPLQACEVMVRDVFSSRELNQTIRRSQSLEPSAQEIAAVRTAPKTLNQEKPVSPEGLLKPSLHAKILSRLFWPSLHDDAFSLPPEIVHLQERYQAGFEAVKNARKLTWLNALGQVTVELDLEDRVVVEQVHTWQATVIYAFNEGKEDDKTQTHTVDDLVEHLEMSESLVRSALKFWTEKFVLQEVEPGRYTVLETLSNADRERSNAQAAANIATGQSSSSGNVERDVGSNAEGPSGGKPEMDGKGERYASFIKGMLKNSATQMPVQQISMMLKMLMIDGFPYGDDELRGFLMRMVDKGELEVKGGKFKLKK